MATGYKRKWETRRKGGRSAGDEAKESYYGLPVIHKPHWKWEIYSYFFLGGIAGASYVLAVAARWFGGTDGTPIVRAGRYISFLTMIPSPILLILDLKRPDRFHHMMRVFKVRSPMSVGTWVLLVFSLFATLAAAIQAAQDGLVGRKTRLARLLRALPERALGALGTLPALFLAGYTGVLLAATAVPLWTRNSLLMGPLFVASAFSNAAAAITLILSLKRGTSSGTLKRLERFDSLAMLAELVLLAVFRAKLSSTVARPMVEGRLGKIHKVGTIGAGIGVPLALQSKTVVFGGKPTRSLAIVASLLTLIGGFLFRYVIVTAGKASADDPMATFEMTSSNGHQPEQRR